MAVDLSELLVIGVSTREFFNPYTHLQSMSLVAPSGKVSYETNSPLDKLQKQQ
jgi:hypothetical protein